MKTQDFIQQQKQRIERGETLKNSVRHSASVMATNDRIYSYGYHYPLLFQITTPSGKRVWVCNNGGYSATTGKHISYSGYLADVRAPIGGTDGRTIERENVIIAIETRINSLEKQLSEKKRKDTQVYRHLASELQKYSDYLDIVTN